MNHWFRCLIVIAAAFAMAPAPWTRGAFASHQSAAETGDEITVRAKGEGADPAEAKNEATRAEFPKAASWPSLPTDHGLRRPATSRGNHGRQFR